MTRAPRPPVWPSCGRGAGPDDPVGCRGRAVPRPGGGPRACLAHLDGAGRAAYLAGLRPGAAVDHRGTAFTDGLLDALLDALRDGGSGRAVVGHAAFEEALFLAEARFTGSAFPDGGCFDGATFLGRADFNDTAFGGEASFRKASFPDGAWFHAAEFAGHAGFGEARFGRDAGFSRAEFAAGAGFAHAVFSDSAHFSAARLHGEVCFREADFHGDCYLGATVFHDGVTFRGATFRAAPTLGPLACRGTLDLSRTRFLGTTTLEAAAGTVDCRKSFWASAAALRLRYATVDLVDVIAERSLSVTAHPRPFLPGAAGGRPPFEEVVTGSGPGVRVRSLSGSDAGNLALNDLDLSDCLFGGALHLDRLGLEGCCVFARAPGRRMPLFRRWTPRRVLAEEHHWRAARGSRGWTPAPEGVEVRTPGALASTYRQLRTSLENGKNHPGAGDFHYGEMEMRRHAGERADGQRALLFLYWAVSGYALRVGRTLLWLAATTVAAVAAVALWGVPPEPHRPAVRAASAARAVPAERAAPERRRAGDRLETSVRTVLNAVGLRAGPADLTLAGTCVDGAFRLVAPVLLGLTAVAVRNRVRR
ncbi:pentapeptide repeat-containing protein [Streptomyces sp. URMC 126]|uniref:pentapeptide repeat-containing protein n=1 Tax=Streptomyces sp. URMC 126 TaxID=3423401 RepID=UPI003F1DB514